MWNAGRIQKVDPLNLEPLEWEGIATKFLPALRDGAEQLIERAVYAGTTGPMAQLGAGPFRSLSSRWLN